MKKKKKKKKCKRCDVNAYLAKRKASGRFGNYSTLGQVNFGSFLIDAAEQFIKYRPRVPIVVTPQMLDRWWRAHEWNYIKKHLRHCDNSVPGILATITHHGRPHYKLIEGFHRATNHRAARTSWTCYVLTAEESYAILSPDV